MQALTSLLAGAPFGFIDSVSHGVVTQEFDYVVMCALLSPVVGPMVCQSGKAFAVAATVVLALPTLGC